MPNWLCSLLIFFVALWALGKLHDWLRHRRRDTPATLYIVPPARGNASAHLMGAGLGVAQTPIDPALRTRFEQLGPFAGANFLMPANDSVSSIGNISSAGIVDRPPSFAEGEE